ncbi:RNA 3'-terminal phosphate cyclase [Halarchaeum sp. P4]|uniref:RNA 3'-terminal phosphate cyclase n=1 Tax=Halarchaeum sp. P4 TaxID=3421639 RepID=UPI003EBCF0D1
MLTLSGAAGGGQLVRTAATFAALTGRAVEVTDVRGAREQPGLKRQHVAAVEAVAAACDADVEGAAVGSEHVTIDPGTLAGGEARVDVETAGSIPLILDAVLPLAARLDAPYRVTVTGGTDVRWAPPMDFFREVKLPVLRRHGLDASETVTRRGFYPAGGGEVTLTLRPSTFEALDLAERGRPKHIAVESVASESLRDADVAHRQADAAVEALQSNAAVPVLRETSYDRTTSPGSVVTVVAVYEHTRAGFSALGEQGKPAEDVADEAVAAFESFRETAASVDRHLADQLLPFLALAGGTYTTPERTAHLDTHVELLEAFAFDVDVAEAEGRVRVSR